jgi:hypothetical protein
MERQEDALSIPLSQFHIILPHLILFSYFLEVLFETAKIYDQPDPHKNLEKRFSLFR